MNKYLENIYNDLQNKYPYEKEYLAGVNEFLLSMDNYVNNNPKIITSKVIEYLTIPDRIITFKVVWEDDKQVTHINTGYRVQHSNAIGPYKGGLRFHPSVNLSTLKMLAFEQTFKNSLTGLPMGGAKGGSDFDPKGKSENEIKRFCQAFIKELSKYIGADIDVPAGDINVSSKEIGYMYGEYKKLTNVTNGVLTGKGLAFGGSLVRNEATGYGLCYIVAKALEVYNNMTFVNKKVIVSGSGNVARYAAIKAIDSQAIVVAMSDSNGYIYDPDGLDINKIVDIKENQHGRIKEYLNTYPNTKYVDNCKHIWQEKCDIALPCATQFELLEDDAKLLIDNGCICVAEGANMPCSLEAAKLFIANKVIYIPGKAANAGGVAVSGIEMTQNSERVSYSFNEVDNKLKEIMNNIFTTIYEASVLNKDKYNLVSGANISGFKKVAKAISGQGLI